MVAKDFQGISLQPAQKGKYGLVIIMYTSLCSGISLEVEVYISFQFNSFHGKRGISIWANYYNS